MRLSEIVNTLTAYRNLQAGLAGRAVNAADKGAAADTGSGLTADQQPADASSFDWLNSAQDTVQLSDTSGADQQPAAADSTDNSLGAIVEGFVRQRQTYAFTLPGIKGVSSPISVTWEVEKAYHVIQFVPAGQAIDQQA